MTREAASGRSSRAISPRLLAPVRQLLVPATSVFFRERVDEVDPQLVATGPLPSGNIPAHAAACDG